MRCLLPILLLLTACRSEESKAPLPLTAELTKPGVLEIRGATSVDTVEVRDASGNPVARAQSFGRDAFEMRFDWQPGTSYRIVPDIGNTFTIDAPSSRPALAIRIQAPLGQNVQEYLLYTDQPAADRTPIAVLADPNETIDILVEIEMQAEGRPIQAVLSLGPDRTGNDLPRMDPVIAGVPVQLRYEFDNALFQSRVHIGNALPSGDAVLTLTGDGVDFKTHFVFARRNLSEADLTVVSWDLPCDDQGLFMPGRAPNQISLPNPIWQKVGSFFNVQTERVSYFEPFVFEHLLLENHRDQPVNLLLKSAAVNPRDGSMVSFFSAPDYFSKGIVQPVMGYCKVPPNATAACIMPIFVRPETQAGTYTREITMFPMGSDKPLRTLKGTVGVLRSNSLFSLWLAVTILISVAWLVLVVIFYRRIVTSFGVRVLTLLSLLGALKFCLGFGTELLNQVLYGLLGPFNCLVGGLLSEVVTYLLITSVLFLVPRVGAMTIAGIVCYLIRGILFGSFGLTDILFTGSSIAFFEIFLFVFGVTRFRQTPHHKPKILAMMPALAIADAAATFTALTLHSVFYRLFFADWYIVLQVGVTGFLYTLIGVYLGRSLGQSLKKVHL